jgi:hypothetical protein
MPDLDSVAASECQHRESAVSFERERFSKLRSKCWMVERCIECGSLLDHVRVNKGSETPASRKAS